jgi:cytochrome b561
MSAEVKRYHSVLIFLHWLLAFAILLAIYYGGVVLGGLENTDAHKPDVLRAHMVIGVLILLFTLVRLAVRVTSAKPAPLVTGKPVMDKVATGIHHLLYTLTALVVVAGLALAASADLFRVLFAHAGKLPADFDTFAAHGVHAALAYTLLGVVALHVAGALQHQFILKDGIFARMSLRGK